MNRVYVVNGLRTYIGRKKGMYRNILPEQLGAAVLNAINTRNRAAPAEQVIAGNAAGTGGNLARTAALLGGLSCPAVTVDLQCASGLYSIEAGYTAIASGLNHCVICGGMESSSLQPERVYHQDDPRSKELHITSYFSAQFSPREIGENVMLEGAERTVCREQISRETLDQAALQSHQKAAGAKDIIKSCILPVFGAAKDECIKENISMRLLSRLKPAVGEHTTGGNACMMNDGAAFLLLCSEHYVKKYCLVPKAEIIGFSNTAGDPLFSPSCAGEAADQLMKSHSLSPDKIGAYEFNEAFAVIDILFTRKYPTLTERYNRFGGALAYGHPYGASGAVIVLHLLLSMEQSPLSYGIGAVAAAGGQGCGILLRKVTP